MRILAFDPGTKRIGVAVSDETMLIATPVGFIKNNDRLEFEIKALAEKYNPAQIVIGKPVHMDGTPSRQTAFADEFTEAVKKALPSAEIVLRDERLTSVEAEGLLIQGDVSRKKRKQLVDKVAAGLILQGYLDFLRQKKK
jgi:putative holliday junction resolvase